MVAEHNRKAQLAACFCRRMFLRNVGAVSEMHDVITQESCRENPKFNIFTTHFSKNLVSVRFLHQAFQLSGAMSVEEEIKIDE
jgi:hypothetical protein